MIEVPRALTAESDLIFDDSCDVLIVGLGAGGGATAIEAAAARADVLVLERASAGGGSTQFSRGFVYLGGGTRVQKLNGFDDTVEDMLSYLAAMILNQPEGVADLIVNSAIFDRTERPFMGQSIIDVWDDCVEIERDLKIPEGALQRKLAEYNAHAEQGEDPEFRKYRDYVQPLSEAPFAAFDCSFGAVPFNGFTLGGLKTDAQARVLNEAGRPIQGLYAAGACAVPSAPPMRCPERSRKS